MTICNEITGELLVSKLNSPEYRNNYGEVFGYSYFMVNKEFRKQHYDLYLNGWKMDSVVDEMLSDNREVRVLLTNDKQESKVVVINL